MLMIMNNLDPAVAQVTTSLVSSPPPGNPALKANMVNMGRAISHVVCMSHCYYPVKSARQNIHYPNAVGFDTVVTELNVIHYNDVTCLHKSLDLFTLYLYCSVSSRAGHLWRKWTSVQ